MGIMAHSDIISAAVHALSRSAIQPYVNSYLAEQATLLLSAKRDGNTLPPVSLFTSSARSRIRVATMAVSLVYFRRLQSRIQFIARSFPYSAHDILLTSLILSDKYLNDNTPSNKWWARNTMVGNYDECGYSTAKINAMERCLLSLLEWNLGVDAEQLSSEIERLRKTIFYQINKPRLAPRARNPRGCGVQQCSNKGNNKRVVKSAASIEQCAQCSICLAQFSTIITPLSCSHELCMTTWLGSIDICSICKLYLGDNSGICRATCR
jgi:hypothetical protein